MRNIKFKSPIESASGRLYCGSNVYLRTNRVTGKSHTGTIRNPYKGPSSASQQAMRNHFRRVMSAVMCQLRDPIQKAKLEEEYASQNEIGTLVGFVYHKLNNEVKE